MNWVQINIQVNEDFRYMKNFTYLYWGTYGPEFFQVLFTTTRFSSVLSCEDLLRAKSCYHFKVRVSRVYLRNEEVWLTKHLNK